MVCNLKDGELQLTWRCAVCGAQRSELPVGSRLGSQAELPQQKGFPGYLLKVPSVYVSRPDSIFSYS